MPSAYGNLKLGRITWMGVGIAVVGETLSLLYVPSAYQGLVLAALLILLSELVVWDLAPMPSINPDRTGRGATIKEQWQRTGALFNRVLVVVMGLWLAYVILYLPDLNHLAGDLVTAAGAAILGVPAFYFLKARLRCPRCRADMRPYRTAIVGPLGIDSRAIWDLYDRCPNCGVSFDEPYRQ